jgi:Lipopolysaccharide-assembly
MPQPNNRRLLTRRTALAALFGSGAAAAAGCAHGGHFDLFGYTTAPNYDPEIRTVYVPVFRTKAFETNPYRNMEMTLTRKVIDAIESKTPMKVVSDPDGADSELQGTVLSISKILTNRTQFNEAREIALYVTCEIVWHDLRPGHEGRILTNPKNRDGTVPPMGGFQFDPENPPQPRKPDAPHPVQVSANGRAMPEVGESNTTALNMAIDRLAVKIVSAMEKPW